MPSTVGRITRYALFAATRLNETHPYSGDTWEYLPGVNTLERPAIWILSDFNAVITSCINWQHHKPLYRRDYHKEGDRTLAAIKGVLHYSPQPGLVLPPVNVEERLWI